MWIDECISFVEKRKELLAYRKYLRTECAIPEEMFLDSEMITGFQNKIKNDNAEQRWLYLDDHKEDFESYGDYWLARAKCAYEVGKCDECLKAIDAYDKLGSGIFYQTRKDKGYAEVLPYGIAAASRIKAGSELIFRLTSYAAKILDNCDDDDWYLQYAAATAYISMYGETNEKEYLEDAYRVTKTNGG